MRKISSFLLILGLGFTPANAFETPESLRFQSAVNLTRTAAPAKFKFTASQYVQLNGNVFLRGTAHYRKGDSIVHLNMSGSATLYGAGGVSAQVSLNESVRVHVREGQSYVSDYVDVSENVSVFKNGRYVGTTYVRGNIRVSGHLSGDWLRLDGSGNLSGSLFVRDDNITANSHVNK